MISTAPFFLLAIKNSSKIQTKPFKAPVRDRTADLSLTMAALYRLSYKGENAKQNDAILRRFLVFYDFTEILQ